MKSDWQRLRALLAVLFLMHNDAENRAARSYTRRVRDVLMSESVRARFSV